MPVADQLNTPTYSVSVIVPTKNRPREIEQALASLSRQSVEPLEVVIVDQSGSEETAQVVQEASRCGSGPDVVYIHDSGIQGASAARNRAMERTKGAIWLFMDDDVVLEPNFLEELLNVYRRYPQTTGVCGMITNYNPPPLPARIWAGLFAWGPFHDERQPLYWKAEALRNAEPIRVTKFGATMMSFRADAIVEIRFDLDPAAFPGEDIDFCLRVAPGSVLLLAPRARGVHKRTPTARDGEHWLRASARSASYLYRKHWRVGVRNRICFWWLQIGYVCAALAGSIKRLSLAPWRALLEGIALSPSPR